MADFTAVIPAPRGFLLRDELGYRSAAFDEIGHAVRTLGMATGAPWFPKVEVLTGAEVEAIIHVTCEWGWRITVPVEEAP